MVVVWKLGNEAGELGFVFSVSREPKGQMRGAAFAVVCPTGLLLLWLLVSCQEGRSL